MKRGQAWGLDLIVASTLFLLGVVVFFFYAINSSGDEKQTLDSLTYQGNIIADDLMSSGSPENWNSTNVVKIGIHSDNKINETKLEHFYNLSQENYAKTKSLFDINYEYFMNLTAPITINSEVIGGIGNEPDNPENLIKITRFTLYKNKPVTLNIYIWE